LSASHFLFVSLNVKNMTVIAASMTVSGRSTFQPTVVLVVGPYVADMSDKDIGRIAITRRFDSTPSDSLKPQIIPECPPNALFFFTSFK
jgi:hypothetical protein